MTSASLIKNLGSIPLIGNALRAIAKRYPEGSIVTIQHGRAAGLKWQRFHRYVNGYWIGHYELPIQEALARELSPGDAFYDVGANAGFFTLVGARAVGTSGRCIAFDPSPENIKSIDSQVRLNGFSHCTTIADAVSDSIGTAQFAFDMPGSSMGHLGSSSPGEQHVSVKTTTLDSVMERFGGPDLVKLDIEGAEGLALKGASQLLQTKRPKWLIELHGDDCEREVKSILQAAGYEFFDLENKPVTDSLPHHVIAKPLKS